MARRHPVVTVAAVLTIVFLWLPLIVVFINSVNADEALLRWGGATPHWFGEVVSDELVREAALNSLQVGVLTAALSLVIAVSGVLWWRRVSPRWQRTFNVSVYARLVLPEVVLATALFLLVTRTGLDVGMAATVLGHTVWASAYATVILQARVRLLDPAVEEAAADLGAGPAGVFFRVTLPGLLPGIAAAAVLAFTLSFDDVVTSYFLNGPRLTTLPVYVLGLIRFRVTPEVNAIGALITLVMIAGALLVVWLLGRAGRRADSVTKRMGY